jgi:hypothetical protein
LSVCNTLSLGKEIAYEKYTDDLEYGTVFTKLDAYMVDLRDDEKHMKFRIGCSFFSWFTCAVGIFVILYSTASTKGSICPPYTVEVSTTTNIFFYSVPKSTESLMDVFRGLRA